MEEQHNSIDEMFRQSLGDYREAPPAAAWGEISRRLDEDERRPRAFFMRWPWLAMLLLLIAGGTWFTIAMHNGINNRNNRELAQKGRKSNNTPARSAAAIESLPATIDHRADENIPGSIPVIAESPGTQEAAERDGQSPIGPGQSTRSRNNHDKKDLVSGQLSASKDHPANTTKQSMRSLPGNDLTLNSEGKGHVAAAQSGEPKPIEPVRQLLPARSRPIGISHAANQKPRATDAAALTLAGHYQQQPLESADAQFATPSNKPTLQKETKEGFQSGVGLSAVSSGTSTKATTPRPRKRKPATAGNGIQGSANTQLTTPDDQVADINLPRGMNSNSMGENRPANGTAAAIPAGATREKPAGKEPMIIVVPARTVRGTMISATLSVMPERALAMKATAITQTDKQPLGKTEPEMITQEPQPPADTTPTVLKAKTKPVLSFAAMIGYEAGLMKPAPNRVAVAGRLQYHINKAFGIGIQPSFRFGSIASAPINDTKAYQRITTYDTTFTSLTPSPSIVPSTDTLYNYIIQENFDSIVVKGSSIKGSFWEIELPLILSYKIASAWTIYGGPSLNFGGKLPGASSAEKTTYTTIRRDTLVQSQPVPPSKSVNYFGTTSSLEPFSGYKPAVVTDAAGMRLGYLLGVSYQRQRLFFDASLHQQLSGYNNVNQQLQKIYSGPYLRLSLGYYLAPQKHAPKKIID